MTLKIAIVPVTPFEQNCSILVCQETQLAAITDPGGDLPKILDAIEKIGATPEKILLTHGHVDHCAAARRLANQLQIPVIGPQKEDSFWLEQLAIQSQRFGIPGGESFVPDRWLEDGDEVTVGKTVLKVIHCPGHTPGHVVFFSDEDRLAIVGDVLFAGSIGRTDFPRGDYDLLISSILEKLFVLGPDIAFIPGHGPTSTFGQEMKTNPYVGLNA
jgi:glyoxylase-like metal-dependent hydrolase (beta-lactamase superfamily II)